MSTAVAKREAAEVAESSPQLQALLRIASQQTDKKHIRFRKGRGGMVFKYVDGAYVIRELNEAFGWDWDFEADNEEVIDFNGQPFEVRCRGRLTVRFKGQAVTKVQYGSQAIEFIKDKQGNIIAPVTIGDCFKGAATDAMKKCASLLGIALDLYDSDFKPEDVVDAEPEPEPVRPVKPEGAQPTTESRTQWPRIPGIVGQIFGKCQALGWTKSQLADEVYRRFKCSIPEGVILSDLDGALHSHELKALDQALTGEFENRKGQRP